jgi:hypothetical protein
MRDQSRAILGIGAPASPTNDDCGHGRAPLLTYGLKPLDLAPASRHTQGHADKRLLLWQTVCCQHDSGAHQ